MLALTEMPYQRSWGDELQKIQLKREVAGTSRIEGAEFTEKELDAAMRETAEQLETRSQRQAAAALAAYRWIAGLPGDRPIDEALIREVHRRIVTGCDDPLPARAAPGGGPERHLWRSAASRRRRRHGLLDGSWAARGGARHAVPGSRPARPGPGASLLRRGDAPVPGRQRSHCLPLLRQRAPGPRPWHVTRPFTQVAQGRAGRGLRPVRQFWRRPGADRGRGKGMKRMPLAVTDPDLARALPALKRAGAAAWRLAVETGTPFYVIENGRVMDRNAARKKRVFRWP